VFVETGALLLYGGFGNEYITVRRMPHLPSGRLLFAVWYGTPAALTA
jgi:hypothetical protein